MHGRDFVGGAIVASPKTDLPTLAEQGVSKRQASIHEIASVFANAPARLIPSEAASGVNAP